MQVHVVVTVQTCYSSSLPITLSPRIQYGGRFLVSLLILYWKPLWYSIEQAMTAVFQIIYNALQCISHSTSLKYWKSCKINTKDYDGKCPSLLDRFYVPRLVLRVWSASFSEIIKPLKKKYVSSSAWRLEGLQEITLILNIIKYIVLGWEFHCEAQGKQNKGTISRNYIWTIFLLS
jgi:hypothetical protein